MIFWLLYSIYLQGTPRNSIGTEKNSIGKYFGIFTVTDLGLRGRSDYIPFPNT